MSIIVAIIVAVGLGCVCIRGTRKFNRWRNSDAGRDNIVRMSTRRSHRRFDDTTSGEPPIALRSGAASPTPGEPQRNRVPEHVVREIDSDLVDIQL